MVMIERTIDDRSIAFSLDGNLKEILDGFYDAVWNHGTSACIVGDGRSGMGKSTKMNQIAITLDKNFSLKKVHFLPDSFLHGEKYGKIGLAEAQKGDFILFDEAMLISNRSAMSAINKMIVQGMSMIRSKQIFIGFCVNSCFDLDKNLILHRADLLFHVYGQNLKDRGRFCCFFKGKDGIDRIKVLYINGRKTYDYSKPPANLIGRFTKQFVLDESKYEEEKQHGVNTFLKSGKNFEKKEIILRLKAKGMSNPEIAKIMGVSRQYIWLITGENMENPGDSVNVNGKNII